MLLVGAWSLAYSQEDTVIGSGISGMFKSYGSTQKYFEHFCCCSLSRRFSDLQSPMDLAGSFFLHVVDQVLSRRGHAFGSPLKFSGKDETAN